MPFPVLEIVFTTLWLSLLAQILLAQEAPGWPSPAHMLLPLSQVWPGLGPEQAFPVFGQLSGEATLSVFCP